MTGRAVGIDIGGTNVRVAVGVPSEPGSATIRRVATPHSYAGLLDVVLDMVRELSPDDVHPSAVGVGIPGTTTGQRAEFVPALPFLDGVPIGSDLQDRLHRPVRLANDAHCALLAEHRIGAAVGRSSAVMLVIGTGVGGAMLFNDRLYGGAHGAAGAFGWLPALCESDERHGGFEQLASGRAVERLAEALGTSAPRMFDAARAGDPASRAAVSSYGHALGRGLATVASVLDPEILVVGGIVVAQLELLAPAIDEAMTEWASPSGRGIPIVAAHLGVDAGVIGALSLAHAEPAGLR